MRALYRVHRNAQASEGVNLSRKLFTVGPVNVEPEVLQAMTKPMITHRTKEYKQLHGNIVEKMKKVLETDMDVLLVGGSASVFLEGCIRNGVKKDVLGITNGSFGDRWVEISKLNGKNVTEIKVPWGNGIRPSHIEGKVGKNEAVHFVSNESSTGTFSSTQVLADEIRKQGDALIFVDGVTSVAGMPLDLKKADIDALVFGSQKALALPPGLAFAAVSERLLKKAKEVENRGFYTDLLKLKKSNDENYALTTPPVSLMYALDFQLDRILREGMKARYRRHKEMGDMVRKWAGKYGGIFPEEGFRSNTIGVMNRAGLDFDEFHKKLKAEGYEISNGYGEVKERTFRIGHMGDITPARLKELLTVMDKIMEESK